MNNQWSCYKTNADSHHSNLYPKDLLETCKPNGIDLLWLDYGEPQKGMYQCDQEAAPARYVEQGNNIQSATDISTA